MPRSGILYWRRHIEHTANQGGSLRRLFCDCFHAFYRSECRDIKTAEGGDNCVRSRHQRPTMTRGKWHPEREPHLRQPRTGEINCERFNSNNINTRYQSWNYRGCWHQTCPLADPTCWVWIASIGKSTSLLKESLGSFCSLLPQQTNRVVIGQFTRLLSALAAVAVSQASSPESNPDSPLPVKVIVAPCATISADRSEAHAATQPVRRQFLGV